MIVRTRCQPPARRTALTRVEVIVVIIALAVVGTLLVAINRRTTSRRAFCASNLGAILRGVKVYANDNEDWFPSAYHTQVDPSSAGNQQPVSFIGQVSRRYWLPSDDPDVVDSQSPSRSLFLLIVNGTCASNQFVCPESGDVPADLRVGVARPRPGLPMDFFGYPNVSYGYQLPFGPRARPNEELDSRVPIVADKGPFFEADSTNADGATPDRLKTGLTAGARIFDALLTADQLRQKPDDWWRPYNSRNHGRQGQYVGYQDGHVDFEKRPIAGINGDNIYTWQSGWRIEDSLIGNVPQDKRGPWTQTDSVIVP